VGAAPWPFTPIAADPSPKTLNVSSDIGRIAAIEGLDFLVSTLTQDRIYAGAARTGEDMQSSPLLIYSEILAHALGKPVIASSGGVPETQSSAVPPEVFQKGLLASMAASPNGISALWSEGIGKEGHLLASVNEYVSRLVNPVSPVGFLFSQRGARHAKPHTYETVWQFYWALAKQLLFTEKLPMRLVHADALAKSLESNSELQLIVMEEHFPLSIAQAQILRQWWNAAPGRGILIFGSGVGYSADNDRPGEQPLAQAFSEIFQMLGVRQTSDIRIPVAGGKLRLKHIARTVKTAFLGEHSEIETDAIASVERIFGSRSVVLYADEAAETPVIVRYTVGETLGLFCGLGLSHATAPVAGNIVKYALNQLGAPPQIVRSSSPGVLWSSDRAEYVVVTNASDIPAEAELARGKYLIWDVMDRRFLPDGQAATISVEPLSFRMFRRIGKRSKLFDVIGAIYVDSIVDGAGRADITAYTGSRVTLIVKSTPKEAFVDGRAVATFEKDIEGAVEIVLENLSVGNHSLTLRW
jgi:hypothetical protein